MAGGYVCKDLQTDIHNCGGCGAIDEGEDCTVFDDRATATCHAGECQCECVKSLVGLSNSLTDMLYCCRCMPERLGSHSFWLRAVQPLTGTSGCQDASFGKAEEAVFEEVVFVEP